MSANTLVSAYINNNESLSGEVDLGSFTYIGIQLPSTWNGGNLTFQVKSKIFSKAGVTPVAEDWVNMLDDTGTEVNITATAGAKYIGIGTTTKIYAIAGSRFIRVRSGTSAAPVNQSLNGLPILFHLIEP